MNSGELRENFIEFFKEKGHRVIPSASLVPENDITESAKTLFTTAGMQQFKRFYSNPAEAPYACATSCQKCIRTGDIDEVGDDTHLTFFEMLGNFSFGYPKKQGSYFKEEAIKYAWEFLTEELNFDKKRIHATYFKEDNFVSTDEESLEILKKIDGLKKIIPQGFEDNFWSLGTEGSPGGPTVEFYVDGIEVWNLVFNEFVMMNGKYEKSEYKGVDTGMGLERLLTTLNGNDNVYETDLFYPITKSIEEATRPGKRDAVAIRRIADHKRAIKNIIEEGVLPGKDGREYVLKTLLRVSFLEIKRLMDTEPIKEFEPGMEALTIALNKQFKDWSSVVKQIYRDLDKEVQETILKAYKSFLDLGQSGITYFKKYYNQPIITGDIIFRGKDTFGLTSEAVVQLWGVAGKEVEKDWEENYEKAFEKHRELSRTASAGMFKGGLADAGEQAVKYHTATHLLHQALRQVLGDHVQQKGSNITADRMRFDFTHPEKMTSEQIKEVEDIVNDNIQANLQVAMKEMSPEKAKKSGALGLFEHKYGDKVKVYTIESPQGGEAISREICGGPHVTCTGELGIFKILKEESSSAGVRRIKAILE